MSIGFDTERREVGDRFKIYTRLLDASCSLGEVPCLHCQLQFSLVRSIYNNSDQIGDEG